MCAGVCVRVSAPRQRKVDTRRTYLVRALEAHSRSYFPMSSILFSALFRYALLPCVCVCVCVVAFAIVEVASVHPRSMRVRVNVCAGLTGGS